MKLIKKNLNAEFLGKSHWKIPKIKRSISLPIKDTSYFTASIFQKMLALNNIQSNEIQKISKIPNTAILLTSHKSESLFEILKHNLKYSHNLTSEILLLQIAKKRQCVFQNIREAGNCLKKYYIK